MLHVLVAIVSFLSMEPVTYAVHRWVMHGPGLGWHRSHHGPRRGRFEANDGFPVVFAGLVGILLVVGFNVEGAGVCIAVGSGVTAYGAAYALVHDGYIHHRLPVLRRRRRLLEPLATAHARHHRDGGEPYGMLLPIVPASRRAGTDREPTPVTTADAR